MTIVRGGDPTVVPQIVKGPDLEEGQVLILRGWKFRCDGLFQTDLLDEYDKPIVGYLMIPIEPHGAYISPEVES